MQRVSRFAIKIASIKSCLISIKWEENKQQRQSKSINQKDSKWKSKFCDAHQKIDWFCSMAAVRDYWPNDKTEKNNEGNLLCVLFLSVSELPQGTNITLTALQFIPFNFDHLVIISLHYCAVPEFPLSLFTMRGIKNCLEVARGLRTSPSRWTISIILPLLMTLEECLLSRHYNNIVGIIKNLLI